MFRRVGLLIVACGWLVGCGDGGPRLVPVTGQVTLDGQPLPNAMVTFNPTGAGGSNSLGKTDSAGQYRLEFSQDKAGALVGDYIVEITTKKISKSELPDDGSVPESAVAAEIPAKYRQRGALTATVKDQANTIDFQLTSR